MTYSVGQEGKIKRKLLLLMAFVVAAGAVSAFFIFRDKPLPPAPVQSTEPYLDIGAWGARLPLSVGNRDMYYRIVNLPGDGGEAAYIFSKEVDLLKNKNGTPCKDPRYPLLIINRVSSNRGVLLNNPNMPDYDPNSGPYKSYSFDPRNMFGPVKTTADRIPRCANLTAGSGVYEPDEAVLKVYEAKRKALSEAYSRMNAVPNAPKND